MFWKKNPTIDWVHLTFWAALFIAVMSAVALVVLYGASVLAGDWLVSFGSNSGEKSVRVSATLPGVAVVAANYEREIGDLVNYVSSTTDADETVRKNVKNKMNELRVPTERRDAHLNLYLQFEKEFAGGILDRKALMEKLNSLLVK